MQLEPFVAEVRSQLVASASLGDESTQATARALAAATDAAVRLALLGAMAAAADEINAALLDAPASPAVSVQLEGGDVRIDVRLAEGTDRPEAAPAPPVDEADSTARISLRLPEQLKGQIEGAAKAGGVSVNTWIVRAAASALGGQKEGWRAYVRDGGRGQRLTGWING